MHQPCPTLETGAQVSKQSWEDFTTMWKPQERGLARKGQRGLGQPKWAGPATRADGAGVSLCAQQLRGQVKQRRGTSSQLLAKWGAGQRGRGAPHTQLRPSQRCYRGLGGGGWVFFCSPLREEEAQADPSLLANPVTSAPWSLCCPQGLSEAETQQTTLQSPSGKHFQVPGVGPPATEELRVGVTCPRYI